FCSFAVLLTNDRHHRGYGAIQLVFSSLIFIFLFLPLVLILYYSVPSLYLRNWILVISSVIFYAWGEPFWVILLLMSATVDYFNGKFIEKHRGKPIAKLGLINTMLFNLGCLSVFKYSGFIIENVNAVTGFKIPEPGFTLPVGISFYVFMSISYTLDVWYGRVKAQQSFASFLVYIANFHHLVAGPIIRYGHIANEITERFFKWVDFHQGVNRFSKGLFKKVCIANTAGALAVPLLAQDAESATVLGAWIGILLFSLQIYFDFSGYSDMAIGLGKMFGFHYHENFKHPYTAKSITDFWRRWHISLSSFFKDYVYIPLGGNRYKQVRNILVVWMLTGVWHGASWNFIFWGLYFGLLLLVEKFVLNKILEKLPAIFQHGYAIFFILIGWAIFYFTDLNQLWTHLQIMFGVISAPLADYEDFSLLNSNAYWLALALILCFPVHRKMQEFLQKRFSPTVVAMADFAQNLLYLGCAIALLVGSTYNPFIYFRF
ncbi:MAG: MBOAT family O-acyltransferase, partial [Acinetobacter sp.]|nr:MBOAT family O-acyltransferase [Acinetobacter sp.]